MRNRLPRGPKPPKLDISQEQAEILKAVIARRQSSQALVQRAKIVLACSEYGRRNQQIAEQLKVSAPTVKLWRGRWLENQVAIGEVENNGEPKELKMRILSVLTDHQRKGAPAKFSPEQICQIVAVACESPGLSDRPIQDWTPRELTQEVIKRQIVPSISETQVRTFLKTRQT